MRPYVNWPLRVQMAEITKRHALIALNTEIEHRMNCGLRVRSTPELEPLREANRLASAALWDARQHLKRAQARGRWL